LIHRDRSLPQGGLDPKAGTAVAAAGVRDDGDLRRVEDLDVVECGEEGSGGVTDVVRDAADADTVAVCGAVDAGN
jgi:hypothetical protein